MKPNKDEQQVIDCLTNQGFSKIQFEPDGNTPPDLLVNNTIAIEVRRLNQNVVTNSVLEGLEKADNQVLGIVKKKIKNCSAEQFNKSAYIKLYFKRPVPSVREIESFLKQVLESHKEVIDTEIEYICNENFIITIIPSNSKLTQQYCLGIIIDGDMGGFVLSQIYDNLNYIIHEKQRKIAPFRYNYPEWWLALVDTIGFNLSDLDIIDLKKLPRIQHQFDRILLVSALDNKRYTYLFE